MGPPANRRERHFASIFCAGSQNGGVWGRGSGTSFIVFAALSGPTRGTLAGARSRFLLAARLPPWHNRLMPRTARAAVGGYCCHVIDRGDARAEVFHDPERFLARFVRLVRSARVHVPMRVVAS